MTKTEAVLIYILEIVCVMAIFSMPVFSQLESRARVAIMYMGIVLISIFEGRIYVG